MGLVFHDGTSPLYGAYTRNRAWDNRALLFNPPNFLTVYNNEAAIRGVLKHASSNLTYHTSGKFMDPKTMKLETRAIEVNLANYINSRDVNLWVIKGLHQVSDPHITCGHEGRLWHLYMATDNRTAWVTNLSQGEQVSATDADGFQNASGKKKGR
jgi:hypothetical protein